MDDLIKKDYDIFSYTDPMSVDWSRIKFSLIEDVLLDPVDVYKYREKYGPGHYEVSFRWVKGDNTPQDTTKMGISPAMRNYNAKIARRAS